MTDDKEILDIFHQHDMRPSVQRVVIYRYLLEHRTHPTVDAIYNGLAPYYSTLSKTTVYNTLKALAQNKLIQIVNIEDGELRYDAEIKPHLHFKCSSCGKIFDIFDEQKILQFNEDCRHDLPEGFTASSIQTNILGFCDQCRK